MPIFHAPAKESIAQLNNRVTESLQFVYGVPYEIVSTQTLDASSIPLFQGVQVTFPIVVPAAM
jgi:hypothetical protein